MEHSHKHKFLTISSFMWQLTYNNIQTQLNLPSTLETETAEKITPNTIFLISAQNSYRETLYTKDLKYGIV